VKRRAAADATYDVATVPNEQVAARGAWLKYIEQ
jgi:hypothetical protein